MFQIQDGCKSNRTDKSQRSQISTRNTSYCAPNGWPLSIGLIGISLHLSQLQPSLLRPGDCYLCLRNHNIGGIEVALVWRNQTTVGIHTLITDTQPINSTSIFESIVSLEMEIEKNCDDLSDILQNLLISVEHSVERVELDDLTFPCPQCCHLSFKKNNDEIIPGIRCQCQQSDEVVEKVEKKVQSSPMFEFSKTIPHIDSDEDQTDSLGGMVNSDKEVANDSSAESG